MALAVEKEGNTVEEAIKAALDELGVDLSDAKIEIIEEGKKGLFGIRSISRAKVRVSVIERGVDKSLTLIKGIMDHLNVKGEIDVEETQDSIKININGSDIGILIGKHGDTLSAIQTIVNIAVKKAGIEKKIIIDVESYRERRIENIKEIAKQAAYRADRTGRTVLLKPMNSYDRRMVYLALQSDNKVITTSEGEEPDRHVKITPKR